MFDADEVWTLFRPGKQSMLSMRLPETVDGPANKRLERTAQNAAAQPQAVRQPKPRSVDRLSGATSTRSGV